MRRRGRPGLTGDEGANGGLLSDEEFTAMKAKLLGL